MEYNMSITDYNMVQSRSWHHAVWNFEFMPGDINTVRKKKTFTLLQNALLSTPNDILQNSIFRSIRDLLET